MLTVVGVAIIAHGRLLAARRSGPRDTAGRWELPGGKVHPGETVAEAAVREVEEELGCSVVVVGELDGRVPIGAGLELVAVEAQLLAGEPIPVEHDAIRWLAPEELREPDWLEPDRPFLATLERRLLDGETMAGGNVGGSVRIGPTVRRPTGRWTPAVHALLEHLQRAGLDGVPRVLGTDAAGREVLAFLAGRVPDVDAETVSDGVLADAMRWLRRYHEAVVGFDHPGPWRNQPGPCGPGQLVCHHDFAPYNVALSSSATGERLVGVFDWDMAAPGSALDDLAFAAWNWVPLYRSAAPADAAARLRLMAESYGQPTSGKQILAGVVPRIERSIRVITAGQRAGDAGMVNLGLVGEPARTAATLDDLRTRIPQIEQELT